MKLNWFSPLPPARTDIANYTTRLLPALAARDIEVKLWSSHPDYDSSLLPKGVQHAPGNSKRLPWPEINFRDHTIYQVGNDHRFHSAIFRHLEQHGGIVVLHETNLHEAQRMRLLEEDASPTSYLARLGAIGGDKAARDGRAHLDGTLAIEEMIARYPLTESVLAGAHGVIVHHLGAVETIRALTAAPVAYLPLPFGSVGTWPKVAKRTWDGQRPVRLVMFGFLHSPNRRLLSVLKAIACSPARHHLQLDLFGELPADFELARYLAELGLSEQVNFHGFVNTAKMNQLLDEADLALNLRNPTRGEASGSLLRIWSHGLPCVVSDSGVFAMMPEDSVYKVPVDEGEILELANLLGQFVEDPAPFFETGLRGRAYLESVHTPEIYVEGLLNFLPLVEDYRGRAYLDHYLPRIAHEFIAELPARAAQDYWVGRVAGILAEGFNGPALTGADA